MVVERAFARTLALLERRRDLLERGAKLLPEKETLDQADLKTLQAELTAQDAVAAQ